MLPASAAASAAAAAATAAWVRCPPLSRSDRPEARSAPAAQWSCWAASKPSTIVSIKPQLQRRWLARNQPGRLRQLGRRLKLAIRHDHFGAPLPLCLGLPRHRPLHFRWQRDVFDLVRGDINAPLLDARIEDALYLDVDFGAPNTSSSSIRPMIDRSVVAASWSRRHILLDPQHRIGWALHIGIDHRIDANRDVVAGDDFCVGIWMTLVRRSTTWARSMPNGSISTRPGCRADADVPAQVGTQSPPLFTEHAEAGGDKQERTKGRQGQKNPHAGQSAKSIRPGGDRGWTARQVDRVSLCPFFGLVHRLDQVFVLLGDDLALTFRLGVSSPSASVSSRGSTLMYLTCSHDPSLLLTSLLFVLEALLHSGCAESAAASLGGVCPVSPMICLAVSRLMATSAVMYLRLSPMTTAWLYERVQLELIFDHLRRDVLPPEVLIRSFAVGDLDRPSLSIRRCPRCGNQPSCSIASAVASAAS